MAHGGLDQIEHLRGRIVIVGELTERLQELVARIGNMNALRRRAPLAWVPSPCLGPVPVT